MRTRSMLFYHQITRRTLRLRSSLCFGVILRSQSALLHVWPQALFCKNATLVVGVRTLFSSHLSRCFLLSLHLNNYSGNISVSREFMDAHGDCSLFVHARTLCDTFPQTLESQILLQRWIIDSKSHRMQSRLFVHPVPVHISKGSSHHVEAFTLLAP